MWQSAPDIILWGQPGPETWEPGHASSKHWRTRIGSDEGREQDGEHRNSFISPIGYLFLKLPPPPCAVLYCMVCNCTCWCCDKNCNGRLELRIETIEQHWRTTLHAILQAGLIVLGCRIKIRLVEVANTSLKSAAIPLPDINEPSLQCAFAANLRQLCEFCLEQQR